MRFTVICSFFARYHFHFSSNPFILFSFNSSNSCGVHTQKRKRVLCAPSSSPQHNCVFLPPMTLHNVQTIFSDDERGRVKINSSRATHGDEEKWNGNSWIEAAWGYVNVLRIALFLDQASEKKPKRANKKAPQEISAKKRTHTKKEYTQNRQVRGILCTFHFYK